MVMILEVLQQVTDDLRATLAEFEPERVSGTDAAQLLERFATIEKLASGGKLLAARRVESSNVWRKKGHRSAAAHVAEATGSGLGPAINALQAARQLGSLPATENAVRDGRLSETQVKEIAGAASVQPDAEQELVDAAASQPLNVLKLRCRRVKATGQDQAAGYQAIHRGRYFRNWTDNEGAIRFDARLTPDEGSRVLAAVHRETERLAGRARRAGCHEPADALAADALVNLAWHGSVVDGTGSVDGPSPARSASGGPTAMVHVRVDHGALMRGHLEAGEVCEIPGVGPIPVEVARSLAVDSILSVLVTDGVDVTTVAHAGRTIPASVRRALTERDPYCVVPGCGLRDGLEIDHVQPFGQGGETRLENLVRLCHWHHYLKTHQKHRIERAGRQWRWIAPPPSPSDTPMLDLSG